MNSAAQAVSAALPIAEWQAESGRQRNLQATSQPLRGAVAAPPVGRILDVTLQALLDALQTAPGGTHLRDAALMSRQSGMTFTAVVLEKPADGLARLAVGGSNFLLRMPPDLEVGDTIGLRLLPHPLDADEAPAAELGTTARLISRLLTGTQSPRPIDSAAPLAALAGNAAQMAASLEKAVSLSGLFYESHLADWIAGRGSKADLLREPQAALASATTDSTTEGTATPRLTPQAETLVQRQLDMLERGEALWRGQAWHGQDAEVRVSRDTHDGGGGEGERAWQAVVKLSLPGLGQVEARIGLQGNAARVDLRASDTQAAHHLQVGRADFARALAMQGLQLADAKVAHVRPA